MWPLFCRFSPRSSRRFSSRSSPTSLLFSSAPLLSSPPGRLPSSRASPRLMTLLCLLVVAVCSPACGLTATHDRITIARATKLPVELTGIAFVVQEDPVEIGIEGSDVVEKRSIATYCVLHEEDTSAFILNTAALLGLLAKHPELRPEVEALKASAIAGSGK